MRVKGSPRVESMPLILLYAASSDLSGNISTIVCCSFKSQSAHNSLQIKSSFWKSRILTHQTTYLPPLTLNYVQILAKKLKRAFAYTYLDD